MPKIQVQGMNGVALLLFVVCVLAGIAAAQATRQQWPLFSGLLVGFYFLFAIKIVRQWRKLPSCAWVVTSACAAPACATSCPSSKR